MGNMMGKIRVVGLLGSVGVTILGLFLLFVFASCRDPKALDAGPMLQNVGTNHATVVWWCHRAESAALNLRNPDGLLRRVPARRDGSRFEVDLDGLQAATAYAYWVECGLPGGDTPQVSGRFRTAPGPGGSSAFLVFGDSGSGSSAQYRLAGVMARHPVDFILHTGDLVYRKGERHDYLKRFHRPYQEILAAAPIYPVLGNHDIRTEQGRPFFDTFALPDNGPPSLPPEHCYWFDYGDARFVAVDSNLSTQVLAEAVAPWLRQVLQASPGQWKIVFFHHSPWAGGGRAANPKMQETLVPAIEAAGADVVFCGHNHLYERTHPLRAGRVAPTNGVVYITSAAGGKSLHREKHAAEPHLATFFNARYSFTLVKISGPTLELVQIGEDDVPVDRLVLTKNPAPRPDGV